MQQIKWNTLKSERLKRTRGISFEEIISAKLVAVKRHPSKDFQDIMLFEYRGYIWVIPFVKGNGYIFLKTIFPSRKYTKLYIRGELK